MANRPKPAGTGGRACPICGKPATKESSPFCSERCRQVDLNRWLSGSYSIPGEPKDDDSPGSESTKDDD